MWANLAACNPGGLQHKANFKNFCKGFSTELLRSQGQCRRPFKVSMGVVHKHRIPASSRSFSHTEHRFKCLGTGQSTCLPSYPQLLGNGFSAFCPWGRGRTLTLQGLLPSIKHGTFCRKHALPNAGGVEARESFWGSSEKLPGPEFHPEDKQGLEL